MEVTKTNKCIVNKMYCKICLIKMFLTAIKESITKVILKLVTFIKFHDSSLLNVKLKVMTLSLTLSYHLQIFVWLFSEHFLTIYIYSNYYYYNSRPAHRLIQGHSLNAMSRVHIFCTSFLKVIT